MFIISRKTSQMVLKYFYTFAALVFLYLAWLDPYVTFTLPLLLHDYPLRSSPTTWRVAFNEHALARRHSFLGTRRDQSCLGNSVNINTFNGAVDRNMECIRGASQNYCPVGRDTMCRSLVGSEVFKGNWRVTSRHNS